MAKKNKKKSEAPEGPPSYIRNYMQKPERFYLMGITGQTSFILENIRGMKFKLTIGNELKCSCQPHAQRHCPHTLYVLSEIFFIPESNPLYWQQKYTDKELRYIIANRRIHTNNLDQFFRVIKERVPKNEIIMQAGQDEQQECCAICHMQIIATDVTTSCQSQCHNRFHIDCFTQWMKHKQKNNEIVKCPLCRNQKDLQTIKSIQHQDYQFKEILNYKKVGLSYNYYCDGCQLQEIMRNDTVYKCVVCEDVTLCEGCFHFGKHIKHSFISKAGLDAKGWGYCEDRKGKKKLDSEQGLIRMKKPQTKLLSNFLACALPCYFSKNNRWNVIECKKLDITIDELECHACNDKQKAFLRRLPCGHFLHHRCLKKRIIKGKLFCKLDGKKFLEGYDSLLKAEKINQIVDEDKESEGMEDNALETSERVNKHLRSDKSSTSCDSRKRGKKSNSIESRNKSLISKFSLNPE